MLPKIFEDFLYSLEFAYSKDKKTVTMYRINLTEFNEYMFNNNPDTNIEDIKKLYADDILIKWLKVRESEGLKASTLNQRISTIRTFYKWLIGRGELTLDISRSIPSFKNTTHQTKEILTVEESWQLLDVAEQQVKEDENYNTLRDQLLCQLFLGCGLRISEVSNLDIDCFNLDEGKLYLTKTKFEKFRKVSMPSEVIYTFTKYMAYRLEKYNTNIDPDLANAVFISRKFNRLSDKQIRLDLYRMFELCGFTKNLTPHSLRHSYGTLMLQSGDVTLEELATEMGHSNVNTLVNWYYHQGEKNISSANPVFNRNKKEETKREVKKEVKDNVIQIRFA